ncbi:hypothetical protein [Rhizobium sp. NFR03]|uniref:hypothetical protein n=1 Tax=Rhizobium sp. NFR03 TaxID=1566263 RepID=UPI0008B2CD36|nr:hypothetical protein [Rhizobium sp. NFR03]SES05286.1 hypothetical protein SAMN03159406_01944 [Rhizobium sp. NFR03]
MAGPYTKLLNVSASGPILYPDAIMDHGTLSVIDFLDNYTWPNEVAVTPVSTTADYKQFDATGLEFEGPPVRFDYPLTVYGGAISYTGAKGRNLILPDCWKLDTGMKHFAMGFWLQMNGAIPNGFNNAIAGFISDSNVVQWIISPIGNSSNAVVNLNPYFRRGAAAWDMSLISALNIAGDIFNSGVHQLVFEYEESEDGSTFVMRFYLDGQLVATSGAFQTSGGNPFLPKATAGKAKIGCPAGYGGGTFTGSFRRAWFQDLVVSNRDLMKMVKIDWDENEDRMRAF